MQFRMADSAAEGGVLLPEPFDRNAAGAPYRERLPHGLALNKSRLLRGLRMAGARVSDPNRLLGVVDAVPNATTGGDFVLPLLHLDAIDMGTLVRTLKRLLAAVPATRILRDPLPS